MVVLLVLLIAKLNFYLAFIQLPDILFAVGLQRENVYMTISLKRSFSKMAVLCLKSRSKILFHRLYQTLFITKLSLDIMLQLFAIPLHFCLTK